jgi:hypothetical protein
MPPERPYDRLWPKKRSREKFTKTPCSSLVGDLNIRLNFNQPFENGKTWAEGMGKSQNMPLLSRFLGTAVLASVIGGTLLNFEWSHAAGPPVMQVTPASVEMMQILRDEHGMMTNMIKAQLSTERMN